MTTSPHLAAARALANEVEAHAREGEAQRRMPDALVEAIRSAGLFHLGVPAALGGAECELATIVDVVEEMSRADGSTGWNLFVGQGTMFVAWLEAGVAKDLVAQDPRFLLSGSFAPTGKAVRDRNDLIVDGRWSFSSGCSHADWFMNGVMVVDGETPDTVAPAPGAWRFAFMPADEVDVVDTWHVAGLRATGSHDNVASGVRVPYDRTIMPFYEPAAFDGPLYRLPFATLLAALICGFPLGVARRALDELTALAQKKSIGPPPSPRMADDGSIQMEIARTEAALRSARAYVDDAVGTAWDTACRGDDATMQQRANSVMAALHAARTARSVVDTVYSLAGGSAVYDHNVIQRCARDVQAGTQHVLFTWTQWRDAGRVLFGLAPEGPRL